MRKKEMSAENAELVVRDVLQRQLLSDRPNVFIGTTDGDEWDIDGAIESIQAVANDLSDKLMSGEDISDGDLIDFTRLGKLEFRIKRYRTMQRLYKLMNKVLEMMEVKLNMGEESLSEVTLNQVRLLVSAFQDQSRAEFGDKAPDTIIDNRKQIVQQINIVEVVKSYDDGKYGRDVIDG